MAYTLNSTVANEFANSYVDLAYADDYWENHFSSVKADTWANLTDEQKTSALIMACRVIDTLRFTDPGVTAYDYIMSYNRRTRTVFSYNQNQRTPTKYFYYQSLQFPRSFDTASQTGDPYIPEAVKMAQCEQALYTINFDETVIANKMQGLGRESVTIGTLKVSQTFTALGSQLSPTALEFLRPYVMKTSTRIGRG